jgi:hypothetical protein
MPDPVDNLPTKPPRYFGTIVPGKIYHWGDHMPHLGLEHVSHLGLEQKRQHLLGRCTINDHLAPEHRQAALLFDTYIDIELGSPSPEKIFFPAYFLARCDDFYQRFGKEWCWSNNRSHDLACAMRQPRYARLIASCWLANNASDLKYKHTQDWDDQERLPALYELLQMGGLKDWTGSWGPGLTMLPKHVIGDWRAGTAADSFEMLYKQVLGQAAVAVVIGAVFWETASEICEKYLYAVYAGCVPLVQGYGIYNSLRALGFDVFDDIIDTSSQYDTNPVSASWNLLELNRDFLLHAREITAQPHVQQRLRANLALAQNSQAVFENAMKNLNTQQAQQLMHQNWDAVTRYFSWHDFTNYRL